jgi:hypothetical protein
MLRHEMWRKYLGLVIVSTWVTLLGVMAIQIALTSDMYLRNTPLSSGGIITPLIEINGTLTPNQTQMVTYHGPWNLLHQLGDILTQTAPYQLDSTNPTNSTSPAFAGAQVNRVSQLIYTSGWWDVAHIMSLIGTSMALLNLAVLGVTIILIRYPLPLRTRRFLQITFYATNWGSKGLIIIAIFCYGLYVHLYHAHTHDRPPNHLVLLVVGFFLIYCLGLVIEIVTSGLRVSKLFWYEDEEHLRLIR